MDIVKKGIEMVVDTKVLKIMLDMVDKVFNKYELKKIGKLFTRMKKGSYFIDSSG